MCDTKKCNKCGRELPVGQFHKRISKSGHIGLQSKCKDCKRTMGIQWRKENLERIRATGAKRKKDNPEKVKAEKARWRRGHKKHKADYERKRRFNNSNHRISCNIRSAMAKALTNGVKSAHTEELLGCSIGYLRQHLESLFTEGMSWDNWGRYGWHIDHIIPLSYFDFTDPEQQKRAWHYTNLRPLWAEDNLKKHDKIIEIQLKLQ